MIVDAQVVPWTRQVRGTSDARPWTERHGVVLTLTDDAGNVGRGDAAPLAGFSVETLEEARTELIFWARGLVARYAPRSLPGMVARTSELALPSSRFAADTALLQLFAARSGRSAAEVLRPPRTPPLDPGRQALVATVDEATKAADDGFATFKVKVGRGAVDVDLAFLATLRERFPSHRLRVDANGAWSRSEARLAVSRLAESGVDLVEQPLEPDDLEGHRQLRGRGPLIALDESVRSLAGLNSAITAQACDAIVLKPTMVGGIFSTLAMARRATGAGIGVALSHAFENEAGQVGLEFLEQVLLGRGYLGAGIDVERCLLPAPTAVGPGQTTPNRSAGCPAGGEVAA